jgi:hypothetical protein
LSVAEVCFTFSSESEGTAQDPFSFRNLVESPDVLLITIPLEPIVPSVEENIGIVFSVHLVAL